MPRSALIKIGLLAAVGFTTLVSFPRSIDTVEFRVITNPLDISVDKASPAFSALEDSRLSYVEEKPEQKVQQIALKSDEESFVGRHIELKPMLISSKTRVIDPNSIEARKIRIARAYADKYVMPPTMKEQAEALVAEEIQKKIEPKTNNNILVATAAEEDKGAQIIKHLTMSAMPKEAAKKKVRSIKVAKNGKLKKTPGGYNPRPDQPEFFDLPMTGSISFQGGSAFVRGYDELVMVHEYADQQIQFGTWSENSNFFRIDLQVPNGEVVAQVYNRDGVLISEGRLDLSSMDMAGLKRLDNIDIPVFPIQEGLKARVVEAKSRGLFVRKNIKEARVEIAGLSTMPFEKKMAQYIDKDIVRPSLALIRATLPDFWPTIKIGKSSHTTYLNMFSNSSVEALQKIVLGDDPRKDIKENSLVWGRVLKDGVPLSGAVVDLAYRDDEKIVYFNGPIPDDSQIMTSNSGEFSIIAKDEGLEVIRVQQIGESILPSFIPTLKGHISDLEVQILSYRQFEFQSYEAFTGLSLPIAMNILGEEDILESNDIGFMSIRRRPILGSSLVEADAGEEFAMTRFSIHERTSLTHVPFFKEDWIKQFPEAQITTSGRATIGDVRGADFTVELIGLPADVEPEVSYYNPDGSLRKESWGVSDGGYVVKGLPAGLNSIVIRPIGSDQIVTEIAVTDDRAVFYNSTNLFM